MNKVITLLFLILLISCQTDVRQIQNKSSENPKGNLKHGEVKTYDKRNQLHTIINYDQGKKHGKSYIYYKGTDQVMLEMNYDQGKRSGVSKKYYENGQIYAITPYKDDMVEGLRKLYYRNGNKKAEIPYHRNQPGIGVKIFDMDGKPETDIPEIVLKKQKINGVNSYVFAAPDCKKARFFRGGLLDNKFFTDRPEFVTPLSSMNIDNQAFIRIDEELPKVLNVICKCQTKGDFPMILRKVVRS